MIGLIWIICSIIMIISAVSTKKNPAKLLTSKARKRKSNLSDEEYVASLYKNSIMLGIVLFILGTLWIIVA